MFTGIISDIGTVVRADIGGEGGRFEIASHYPAQGIELGASIACDGCCLTVVSIDAPAEGGSPESLVVTGLTPGETY